MVRTIVLSIFTAVAITGAPTTQADPGQAGLGRPFSEAGGPFVGVWYAHGEKVGVNADGTGMETSGAGLVNFRLTTVQTSTSPWDTAYGNVTGGNLEPGSFVTIQLVDSGQGMLFSAGGGDTNFPFCKIIKGQKVNSSDCGA